MWVWVHKYLINRQVLCTSVHWLYNNYFAILSHSQTDQERGKIKLKGATLLHNDFQVNQWLKWWQERGFSRQKEHVDFTEVTMDEMDQLYSFKSADFTSGDVELPNKELLEYYMKTEKCFPVHNKYGQKFVYMMLIIFANGSLNPEERENSPIIDYCFHVVHLITCQFCYH